jgi:hypothetical protein
MPEYLTPGVYIEEVSTGARPIEAVGTTGAAFIGQAPNAAAHLGKPMPIVNWGEFRRHFAENAKASTPLANAVAGFFANGGSRAHVVNIGGPADVGAALAALAAIDDIAIIVAPGLADPASTDAILGHCEALGTCFAILDGPAEAADLAALTRVATVAPPAPAPADGERRTRASASAAQAFKPRETEKGFGAYYFPHIQTRDALDPSKIVTVAPSGHIAGMYARSDVERGVFKAPANMSVRGALGVSQRLTDAEQAVLNPQGVNAIRLFSGRGVILWGARTLAPSASEWRYVPVRRLFIMAENSIKRGTQWVVFEPNDERLWKSIRRDVSAFLTLLWRQGALQGATPEEAFFVKCDAETNTQDVIDAGRVVIEIGLAPVKPAEFVIFRIGHTAPEAAR